MKLAVMKSISLAVLLAGLFALGLVFDVSQVQLVKERAIELWPKQDTGALNLRLPAAVLGAAAALLGLYGFLPRIPSRKNKTISFKSSQGDIVLELKPVRKTLLRMMRKMPEVYSVKLDVKPDRDGRRANITADVVLTNCAAVGARACAKLVTEYLATTARNVLGLEDLSTVRVNVRGVRVDVSATGKQVREQVEASREEAESETYALAHAPIAAVTLDESSTENSVAAGMEAQSETAGAAAVVAPAVMKAEADSDGAPEMSGKDAVAEATSIPVVESSLPAAADIPEQEENAPAGGAGVVQESVPAAEPPSPPSDCIADLPPLSSVEDDIEMPAAPPIDEQGEVARDESPSSFDKNFEEDEVMPIAEAMESEMPAERASEDAASADNKENGDSENRWS